MKKKINIVLPNRLAIYIRVSTDKQAKLGVSVDTQLDNGVRKAKELGWTFEVYNDAGKSGSISYFERDGIKRLMKDLDDFKLGGLYCFDIDRLSRDPDFIEPQAIITKFKESGIKIYSNSGELDLSNSSIELMVRLKGVLASSERIQTTERVISNLKNSMMNGNNAGGGQLVLYGYDRISKKLVINNEEAEIVKLIFKYYLEGHGTKVISNLLNEAGVPTKRNKIADGRMTIKRSVRNSVTGESEIINVVKKGSDFVWRDTTIYNMLKNTTYIGKKKFKDIEVDSPVIIDIGDFEAVQAHLKEKMRFKRAPYNNVGKSINQFLLKGLVKCGKCGIGYYGHKRADLHDKAYKCLSQRYKKGWCGNRGIDIDYLDNLVWKHLLQVEDNITTLISLQTRKGFLKALITEIEAHEDKIKENTKHLLTLNRNYNEGKFKENEYVELKKEYENEIIKCQNSIHFVKQTNFLLSNKDALLDIVKDLSKRMKAAMTIDEKQGFLRAFVESITINTRPHTTLQRVQIRYKFNEFSQFYIKNDIDINYKTNWQRIGSKSADVSFWVAEETKDGGKVWNSFEGLVDSSQERAFNSRGAAVIRKNEENENIVRKPEDESTWEIYPSDI